VPLALYERFIDANYLEAMARISDASHSRTAIDQVLTSLEVAGLLHAHGQGIYALHPVLTGFLRARPSASDATDTAWQRAFVEVMGQLAERIAPEPLHVQRPFFALHSANFHTALTAAEHIGMDRHGVFLTQALAVYALHQRDFAQAGQWYRKSLAISEKLGNEHYAAGTYHQLGIIAEEQRDFAQAEQWYRKSLAIKQKLGDEYDAASTYHHLGSIAEEQRDFAQAEQWYRKSLAIKQKLGDEYGAASTYQNLGIIAATQRDFVQAGQWMMRSIVIYVRYNDGYHLQMAARNFLHCYAQAPPAVQPPLKALWEDAGLGPLPAENAQE
jgi:tetratricopeptide (TPR) repeat protein